jgi:hypothetical protein
MAWALDGALMIATAIATFVYDPLPAITNERADRLRKAGVRAGLWSALHFPTGEIFSVVAIGALVAAGVARGPSARPFGGGAHHRLDRPPTLHRNAG